MLFHKLEYNPWDDGLKTACGKAVTSYYHGQPFAIEAMGSRIAVTKDDKLVDCRKCLQVMNVGKFNFEGLGI